MRGSPADGTDVPVIRKYKPRRDLHNWAVQLRDRKIECQEQRRQLNDARRLENRERKHPNQSSLDGWIGKGVKEHVNYH